jgi:hypothetical protein
VNRDVDAEPFPAGGRLVKGSQPFVPRPHLYSRRVNRSALLVVDVQKAFDDPGWGRRNNPACERNIGALIRTWRERGQPVVFIRHDGLEEEEPYDTLRHGTPGNAFKEVVNGEPDLLVAKHVNSAFHGTPDLEAWMRANEIDAFAVCGIQTQMCCETTARVGANLGRHDLRDRRDSHVRPSCVWGRDIDRRRSGARHGFEPRSRVRPCGDHG